MTEGMEHLIETYRQAGLKVSEPVTSGRTLGYGYRYGTGGTTLVYRLLSTIDAHGRVLAQRWGSQQGQAWAPSPGVLPIMIKYSRFDRITNGAWT